MQQASGLVKYCNLATGSCDDEIRANSSDRFFPAVCFVSLQIDGDCKGIRINIIIWLVRNYRNLWKYRNFQRSFGDCMGSSG